MIDREARNKAILLLRQYQTGRSADSELKKAWPGKSRDPALSEILIGLFPSTHYRGLKLKELEITPEERRNRVYRSIIFLEGHLEYEWPREGGFLTWSSLVVAAGVLGAIGLGLYFKTGHHVHYIVGAGVWLLGLLVKKRIQARRLHGDYEVWPFLRRKDYEAELERIELVKGFGLSEYWDQIRA
jgi:hypothetical protein